MTRHTSRNRMDRELHVHTLVDELTGELSHWELRLRDRHAIARRNDHALCCPQHIRNLFRTYFGMRTTLERGRLRRRGHRAIAAESAQDDRNERTIHALAHDVGEVGTGRADERARDDEQIVPQREACHGRRPTRIGVEHRDDHRHIATTDASTRCAPRMSEMIVRMTSGKVPAAIPSVATNQPMHTTQTMTMMRLSRLRLEA